MYVKLSDEKIINIKDKVEISLWDTVEKAESFYSDQDGVYTGLKIDSPLHAYATPIQVYKIKN